MKFLNYFSTWFHWLETLADKKISPLLKTIFYSEFSLETVMETYHHLWFKIFQSVRLYYYSRLNVVTALHRSVNSQTKTKVFIWKQSAILPESQITLFCCSTTPPTQITLLEARILMIVNAFQAFISSEYPNEKSCKI